ncbi:RNA polymerase subunit sigma-70 [Streptomyces vilmorinianum]|uniref:RNA polymerase subunit sigma-70 n=1 Tax=Streptomyces vilmorinianum TaxID=3051092 RepID=UPI0010FB879F|nr:RNA polymerase subunit sigma-70 [Streptomyces vilmorinianum]
MHEHAFPARQFDVYHERLLAVARRMLGSSAEAEEALVEARGRLGGIEAWLSVVVGRVCVERLRARAGSGAGSGAASGYAGASGGAVDSVSLALFAVLESLRPDERLAYVLHDLFALPLPEVARLTCRTTEEAADLARRARRRVRGGGAAGAADDPWRQRAVVETFLAAARTGDAHALAAVLDPEVVAYSERGPVRGAGAVAEGAAAFSRTAPVARPALVDGAIGAVAFAGGRPVSAVVFTIRHDRIVALDITTDPKRLRALALAFPEG